MFLLLWYTPPPVSHAAVIAQPLITFSAAVYNEDDEILPLWWLFVSADGWEIEETNGL